MSGMIERLIGVGPLLLTLSASPSLPHSLPSGQLELTYVRKGGSQQQMLIPGQGMFMKNVHTDFCSYIVDFGDNDCISFSELDLILLGF